MLNRVINLIIYFDKTSCIYISFISMLNNLFNYLSDFIVYTTETFDDRTFGIPIND